jgi:glycosyltransferase involved in cell wall biosynthesis
LVNGVIFLNDSSKEIAFTEHPALAGKTSAVIPHLTYDEIFSTQSKQKEYTYDRPIKVSFFGLIRPYKQLDRLINCMKEISAAESSLAISGASFGYPHIEQQLKELAQGSSNIELSCAYLTHDRLEQFVDECDAVILPYRDVLNSGAAIFALSRLRPVMVPNLKSMLELRSIVGGDWVFCYAGDLTSQRIRDFISWVKKTPRASPPDMSSFDPEVVAAKTVQFYYFLSKIR